MASEGIDHVLIVCSANQCRSPLAAALLRDQLVALGLDVDVTSAGFGVAGQPVTPATAQAARRIGMDLGAHRSVTVRAELLRDVDLLLAMESRNLRDVVALDLDVWFRSFTLKELARRAITHGPRGAGESLRDWAASVHAGRAISELLDSSSGDDVRDPTLSRRADYDAVVAELASLVSVVVGAAWPADSSGTR